MSEKQVMIKILEKLPDDVSLRDILETFSLINDLRNRVDNFDRDAALSTSQLKEEIKLW